MFVRRLQGGNVNISTALGAPLSGLLTDVKAAITSLSSIANAAINSSIAGSCVTALLGNLSQAGCIETFLNATTNLTSQINAALLTCANSTVVPNAQGLLNNLNSLIQDLTAAVNNLLTALDNLLTPLLSNLNTLLGPVSNILGLGR